MRSNAHWHSNNGRATSAKPRAFRRTTRPRHSLIGIGGTCAGGFCLSHAIVTKELVVYLRRGKIF
eukprot:5258307-Heterocapsa_arctica.AAC.1